MKRWFKGWIGVLICLGVFCFCGPVWGAEQEGMVTEVIEIVNPEYKELKPADLSPKAFQEEGHFGEKAARGIPTYNSIKEAGTACLRPNMINRKASITVQFTSTSTDWEGILNQMLAYASEATDATAPNAGDYLRYHWAGVSTRISYYPQSTKFLCRFQMTVTYMSSASQEAAVTSRLKTVMRSLKLDKMKTEYQVIAAIYQYVTSHVTYDYASLTDTEELGKYSAYKALMKGTAVCQGYANLMYRMLREAGLSTRIIAGTSRGINHGWNIVRINGRYYNLDSTWDAGYDLSSYSFFLKNQAQFYNHTRSEEYTSSAFHRRYPMSASSYRPGSSGAYTYKINYALNGGKNNSGNPSGYFGGDVVLRSPQRKGYQFLGWYTDSKFQRKISIIKKSTARNYTVYARWKKIAVARCEIRSFKSDGIGLGIYYKRVGEADGYQICYSKSKSFEKKDTAYVTVPKTKTSRLVKVANPGSRYYVRVRAYRVDSSGARVYGSFGKTVTGYAVKYVLNGGKNASNNPHYYYASSIVLAKPVRKGYQFVGWYADKRYRNKVTQISENKKSNCTLYARWRKNTS